MRFDGQPRAQLIGVPLEAVASLVDVRPAYAALLEQVVSLYVEAIGEECECYRYDSRDSDCTGSISRKSPEVRQRLAALRQEASA